MQTVTVSEADATNAGSSTPRWRRRLGGERVATLVLLFGQIFAAGGAFLVNLLAARVLDPSPRGDLAFALQLSYVFTVLALWGLERPYIATRNNGFFSEYRAFTRMITPGVLAVIPLVVFAVVFLPFSTNWLWVGAALIAAYVLLNTLVRGVRVAYVVSRNWKPFAFNAIATQVVIVLGAVALVVVDADDPRMWMGVYLASTAPSILLLIPLFRDRGGSAPGPDKAERKTLRRRGLVLLPSEFSNTAMLRSDRLLLPILSSPAELGLYVTVATVLEMSTWPIQQWVDASLRRWTAAGADLARSVGKILLQALLFLVVVTAFMAAAAYAMIAFFLPDAYLAAATVILPLAVASVIHGLTRVQQGLLIAFNCAGRVSIVEIIGIIVSVACYFVLIPQFGMLGAAGGSIAGSITTFTVSIIFLTNARKRNRHHDTP